MIHPDLQHLAVPIHTLTPDPQNARRHDDRNLAAIRASLRAFGQRIPIVVQREGMIVRAGNGRLQAALYLGWKEIAAVVVDEADVEAVAFALADNRTAELATWDPEKLRAALARAKHRDAGIDRMLCELEDETPRDVAQKPDDRPGVDLRSEFSILVKCRDEAQQRSLLEAFDRDGHSVRALVVGFPKDEETPAPSTRRVTVREGEVEIVRNTSVVRTPRVMQLEGLFDLPPTEHSEQRWRVALPFANGVAGAGPTGSPGKRLSTIHLTSRSTPREGEAPAEPPNNGSRSSLAARQEPRPSEARPWHVGLIVGPSGSGKSTVAREFFGECLAGDWPWPDDRSIVDAFPEHLSIGAITGLLSSVGFSSPPGWLKPYRVLSNGEQFRVNLARTLAERPELCVVDEFTSVVDRTVAKVASAAVAKAVRSSGRKFVAVSCHADIAEWLQPDWVLEMPTGTFTWRCLQRRPPLELVVYQTGTSAWDLFRAHHYLTHGLNPAARCFVAELEGRPAAFTAVLHAPTPRGGAFWREHRTVCLPDFQGLGIGNALSEFIAGVFTATGKPYRSTTSHPAMIRHRLKSPLWRCTRKPSLGNSGKNLQRVLTAKFRSTAAVYRATASFLWCGAGRREDAERLGVTP